MVDKPNIVITHLYPRSMNIYGDTGNVLTLKNRLERRGFSVTVEKIDIGDSMPLNTDIVVAGGGQDEGQFKVADDLQKRKQELTTMANEGVPMLVICGMYQLFGHWFKTAAGQTIKGVGIFHMTKTAGPERLIGNVLAQSEFGQLVGFENHSGETWLSPKQKPLAKIEKGAGNNSETTDEGAINQNVIGTYCHGPVLPKNPKLADHIIVTVLKNRGYKEDIEPLDDTLANKAAQTAASRPR